MQNQISISGHKLRLDKLDLIGQGGEGVVYRDGKTAIKVYHKPSRSRGDKLQKMLRQTWDLPKDKVAVPQELVTDPITGEVIGFTMPLLGSGFEEISVLSNKRQRAALNIDAKSIVRLFIDGANTLLKIHQNQLIVGDLNDRNQLFRGRDMIFIDVDAWQYGKYPCPVATEQYLVPELYGTDLSLRPVFKQEHDWYSFAVMFFKSLLLTHPYGGVHKQYRRLTERAMRKITVLNKDVIYPKIAVDPSTLTSDLKDVFNTYFEKGWRGPFPIVILENYLSHLEGKPVTALTTRISKQQIQVADGVQVEELISTQGQIIYHKLVGNTFYVIAVEKEYVVLYSYSLQYGAIRKQLFRQAEVAGAKYEIFGKYLAVNIARGEDSTSTVLLFEISADGLKHVVNTSADEFILSRKAMFAASGDRFYRIAGSTLMEGKVQFGNYLETPIRSVMPRQTWFAVDKNHEGDQTPMVGLFQVLDEQYYWCRFQNRTYDLKLPQLQKGEILRSVSANFSSQGVMLRRLTEESGVTYQYIDVISTNGEVVYSSARNKQQDYALGIHGLAYSTGKTLHPTDEGILLEDLFAGGTKLFKNTKPYMAAGFSLQQFGKGVAVVTDEQLLLLELQ